MDKDTVPLAIWGGVLIGILALWMTQDPDPRWLYWLTLGAHAFGLLLLTYRINFDYTPRPVDAYIYGVDTATIVLLIAMMHGGSLS